MITARSGSDWTCPYCNRAQTLTSPKVDSGSYRIVINNHALGPVGLWYIANACANSACRQLSLTVCLTRFVGDGHGGYTITNEVLRKWDLLPESSAKPQPEYIPKPIRDDYFEACRIVTDQPTSTPLRRTSPGVR